MVEIDLPLFSGKPDKPGTRMCTKCGISKPLSEFYKHPLSVGGRDTKCKECVKSAEYKRRHNPETYDAYRERDRQRNRKPERKARRNELRRKRMAQDPVLTATRSIYKMLYRFLEYTGTQKNTKTFRMLGYGPEKLVKRLECQFQPGMGWDNRSQWHIDHKKPIKAFIEQGITDPSIINSLCNLRPMWARDNIIKGASWPVSANDNEPNFSKEAA